MSRNIYVCDANVVIRLLRWDNAKLSPLSKEIFQKAQEGEYTLFFNTATVAEIIWVLSSFYKEDKKSVAGILLEFLQRPGIRLEQPKVTLAALDDLTKKSVDFLDALQARFALEKGYSVMSFDKDFKKWPDLKWSRPSH